MHPALNAALELVYVPKCALCGFLSPRSICTVCDGELEFLDRALSERSPVESLDAAARLYRYHGRAHQAVTRLKYSRVTSLAEPMAGRMLQSIRDLDLVDYDLFIPVPIHPSRRRFRGFNQSELLSERLPAERLRPDLLRRVRATLPQASLSPEQRRTNLKGAFSATAEVLGAHIVLIDDVLTSGTTALECAKALKEAGAREVVAVAFAGG